MKYFAKVAILGHHLQPLTYYSESPIKLGTRVWVYVRNSKKLGLIVGLCDAVPELKRVKQLTAIDQDPCISHELLELAFWMSSYYLTPIAEVLSLMLPGDGFAKASLTDEKTNKILQVSDLGRTAKSKTKAQHEFLDWLQTQKDYLQTWSSCQDAGFSSATIQACYSRKWLLEAVIKQQVSEIKLNLEQQRAVNQILEYDGFAVSVLDGVTGSGKTEVYCRVISEIIAKGKQALVLVPEIGLTQQTVARFVARCGVPALVIHSKITAQQKLARWQAAFSGAAQLVIGTRSSLFAPLKKLGIIVVDESHDPSFKQQNTCLYSARHSAIMLAKLNKIPIILGSATLSLESLYRCQQGMFNAINLTQKAFVNLPPKINILNLCGQASVNGIAIFVKEQIQKTLAEKEQVLIFVNRRGFAPIMLCHACGCSQQCSSCASNFVLHQQPLVLRCHHCSKVVQVPERCQQCGAKSWITPGLGTQKVAEQIQTWFPESKILRIDRDNTKSTSQFNQALIEINNCAAEIIIGTQMLAKGHDFHNVGLVVVLDCDAQLYNPDYMAVERLAQLLVQVAGRAGRREKPGKILVQTHNPEHPVFQVLTMGYKHWAVQELQLRKQYALAPYTFNLNIHVQSQKLQNLDRIRQDFANIKFTNAIKIIGPVANLRPKRKGFWRDIIIITSESRSELHKVAHSIRAIAGSYGWDKLAQLRYDVDPIEQC